MSPLSFDGLRVLSLESRRGAEMRTLIEKYGGQATVAPSIREVPQQAASRVADFTARLAGGGEQHLVCMTGVGTRLFLKDLVRQRSDTLSLLGGVRLVARGNKPQLALREFGLHAELVPRPHTWREVQEFLLRHDLRGHHITLLEYGDPTPPPLLEALSEGGASVMSVPVYRRALPEDTAPLEGALRRTAAGEFDVLLLSSGSQVFNFITLARELGLEGGVRAALSRMAVVSIGPACSEAIGELRLPFDLEVNPHKMGILVRAAAEHAPALLRRKRPERQVITSAV